MSEWLDIPIWLRRHARKAMSDNVIHFADLQFRAKAKRYGWEQDRCAHRKLTLDDNGELVTCDDCGKQVTAYWALRHIVEKWGEHAKVIERRRQVVQQQIEANVSLLAAQRVEKAWRRRKTVPTCPHCNEAIFPEDGFGGSSISREIAQRRRTVKPTRFA